MRRNKAAAWNRIKAVLVSNSTAPQRQETHTDLMLPAFASLEKLTHGSMELEDFVRLNEMNAFGFSLASLMFKQGTDTVKNAVKPTEQIFVDAGNALQSVGLRYNKVGKFGATGDELRQIRDAMNATDELVGLAPEGMTLKALMEAAKMVEATLKGKSHVG